MRIRPDTPSYSNYAYPRYQTAFAMRIVADGNREGQLIHVVEEESKSGVELCNNGDMSEAGRTWILAVNVRGHE